MDFNLSLISENEALVRLSAEEGMDKDELMDALEMQCFQLRDYFLRNPIVIPLYRSRIRKLISLAEAGICLGLLSDANPAPSSRPGFFGSKPSTIEELLRNTESERSRILLEMNQGLNPIHIAQKAEELCDLERWYMNEFLQLAVELRPIESDVKAADRLDSGEALFNVCEPTNNLKAMLAKEKKRILSVIHLT